MNQKRIIFELPEVVGKIYDYNEKSQTAIPISNNQVIFTHGNITSIWLDTHSDLWIELVNGTDRMIAKSHYPQFFSKFSEKDFVGAKNLYALYIEAINPF